MKFSVKAWSNGRARVGVLQLPGCPVSVETPCLLLSTRKGLPHFLSPDLLSSLPSPGSHLLQVSPLHFVEGMSSQTVSNIGGLHQMLGLHEYGFGAILRDSIICLPEPNNTNKTGASFETPSGRLSIKPVEYMKMISSLKPNWSVSVSDEVPAWVTEKRNRISVDRTVQWLDECIKSNETDGAVFGAIVGGCSVEERKRCADEVVKRNVSGYLTRGQASSSLWTLASRKDTSPIVKKCSCYTCQNHSRAYINHLLNVHEMLAHILLEIHNTHRYLEFFRNIKEAIKNEKFDQFRCNFIEKRRNHLVTAETA